MRNIKQLIFELLRDEGCTVDVVAGIVYVKTPEGKVWDFTVPQEYKEVI